MDRPFPAYKGDEPYVFVSYSHSNSSAVYSELVWLKEAGFNIWYDEGISPGFAWRDEVALALTQCSVFLNFITPKSVKLRPLTISPRWNGEVTTTRPHLGMGKSHRN